MMYAPDKAAALDRAIAVVQQQIDFGSIYIDDLLELKQHLVAIKLEILEGIEG